MKTTKGFIPFGVILSLGVVISTYLVTDALRDIRMSHQIIKVRGYAETPVESDMAIWDITVKARDRNMAEAYTVLAEDREKVLNFLQRNQVEAEEIRIRAVSVNERRRRGENGHDTNEIEFFELSQGISVKSRDVHNIAKLSTSTASLLGEGIALRSGMPSYYYTQVNELKSELLIEATKDARERAKTLAEGSGVNLGSLRAARQGVFSVRSGDSSGISEKSTDDVSSISKKVTALVTVDYAMK